MKKIILVLLVCCMHGVVMGQSYSIPQYNNNSEKQTKDSVFENLKSTFSTDYSYDEKKLNTLKERFFLTLKISKVNNYDIDSLNMQKLTDIEMKEYKKLQTDKIISSFSQVNNKKELDFILNKNKDFIYENFTEENYKKINELNQALKDNYTKRNFLSKEKRPKTFYIWNSENYDVNMFNEYFSGKNTFNAFSNIAVQTFLKDTYINSQIISFYFNYLKLSLSGSIKATNNSETDLENIQKELTQILHNNGSLNLNFSLPILYNRDRKEHIHYGLFAETSVGFTPNFETTETAYFSNDLLVTNQVGLNFKFDISSNENEPNKKARFIVELPASYIYGNKKSYELLDITDNSSLKIKLGAVLGDKMNFSILGPLYSTNKSVQRTPFLFSLNFSPDQIINSKKP